MIGTKDIKTEIKGKVGGAVFQGGRSGGIMKNKGTNTAKAKVSPTDEEFAPLSQFSSVVKMWSQITQPQRDSWSALLGVWTFTDKFGDVYNGTPYQIFTAININRETLGLARLPNAPTFIAAEDMDITITDYSSTDGCTFEVLVAASQIQYVLLSASSQQNETKNIGSITFRKIVSLRIPSAGSLDVQPHYLEAYGVNPVIGSFIYFRYWMCYQTYPRQQFFTTVKVSVTG